ncbi:uncharacterized protein LOC131056351 [Cryptomeria japonica]|uniref:uncharacterized protein LOC131056351 n=1 Tax=Cryptomeria japonica TaxID=3369 RepID=UPI0027DA0B6F|nr:uncharacterized protein LOC131056351 [Cryptomeria japonica]
MFAYFRKERWELVSEMYKLAKPFSQLKDFPILNHLHKFKNVEANPVLSTIVEASFTCFFHRPEKKCDKLVLNPLKQARDINRILRRVKEAQGDLVTDLLVHILRLKQQDLFAGEDGTRESHQRENFEKEEEEREKQVREIIKLLRLNILEKERVAVVILGDSGHGTKKLANAVYDCLKVKLSFEGWKLFLEKPAENGELQELVLQIEKMKNEHVLICIENMVQVQHLRRILDMKSMNPKKFRLLVTSLNKGVKALLEEYKFTCEEFICIEDNREDYSQWKNYPLLGEMLEIYHKIANEANKETLNKVSEDNLIYETFNFALEYAFNYLPLRAQDAFLDICFFFSEWDWDEISLIVGKPEVETLEADAWVKRDSTNKISIPEHTLKWARETRRIESGRLTSTVDLQNVLDNEENSMQIKGIWLPGANETVEIPAEKLELMCDTLRVLSLGRTTVVKGNCNKSFEKLIFLQACGTSISFVNLKELRNLSYLSYDRDEDFDPSQLPPELKVVKLCGDEKFKYPVGPGEKECVARRLENLSTIKVQKFQRLRILDPKIFRPNDKLKELSVSSCSVVELPKSLTQLYALQRLDLHDCKNLLKLPNSFGNLLCLTRLDLSYCSSLKRLPESFGKLQRLEELILSFCSALKQLPASFVRLGKLKKVTFSHCFNMHKLPDKFEQLRSLEELDLSYCKSLKFLPVHFELLSSLHFLNLDGCSKLEKLPDNFPESLFSSESVAMKMSGCSSLTELQDEFCQSNKIEDLSLASCTHLERLPNQINELTQLRYLNLSDCQSLRKLPNKFSGLRCLEGLNLRSCHKLRDLCDGFNCLQSLKYLNLSDCPILEAKWLTSVRKIGSLAFVDIRKSQKLEGKWKERLPMPHHFKMITEEKPEDKINNEQNILSKKSSKIFKDKAILVCKDGSTFFPSKEIPEGTTLVLIFDHNNSHWGREMLENNVDELMTNLSEHWQIIYIGKSFSALPPKLADRIIAYTPDNPEALSFFDKCLSINAETDFWSFNTYIIKTKVEEKRFKQWESISGTLTGKNFSLQNYHKLQYTEENTGVDFLEALLKTKEDDRLMSKGNKKVSINDLKKNIIFLLISTVEISKSQMSFLKEMYDEMRNTEHDLKVEWVWFPMPDADKDMSVSNDHTDIPWVVISGKWLMEQSTVNKILRERLGFCEMPILVSLAASGRISIADVMPLLATQGSEACLFLNKVMPRKLSKKDSDKLDMMMKQFHLNVLFKDILMDAEKKLSGFQMIWLYGGDPEKISDFNSKLSRLIKNMDRNCKIQILYVGRGRFLHDINSIKEEEDLHRKNTDGIKWLSLSIKDMKKFWHRMHYLVYLIAYQIREEDKKLLSASNNEEEVKKLNSQKKEEFKKLDSLRRLMLGLLSFDCLSRRNGTVWMMAVDGFNNGNFTGRGKELVDLLSANIEKNIDSSIYIETGVGEVYSRKHFLKGGLIKVEKSSEDLAAKTTFKDAPWFVVHPSSQVEEQISASMSCSICYVGDPVYHCDACGYFGICEKCYIHEFVGNVEVTTH